MEASLSHDDYGRDLASVQNLIKKHQLVEADIAAHEVCFQDLIVATLRSVGKNSARVKQHYIIRFFLSFRIALQICKLKPSTLPKLVILMLILCRINPVKLLIVMISE